jgi:hypothetical protein
MQQLHFLASIECFAGPSEKEFGMSIDSTVFGLPLVGELKGIPLEALVVAKLLDEEGHVSYSVNATQELTAVEALGMAHLGVRRLERVLDVGVSE